MPSSQKENVSNQIEAALAELRTKDPKRYDEELIEIETCLEEFVTSVRAALSNEVIIP
jgi:replication fork clamp-binding protein CrfC